MGDAPTALIHPRDVELSAGAALLRGFAVPGKGLFVIADHAPAVLMHPPDVDLRAGIPLLRGFAIPG